MKKVHLMLQTFQEKFSSFSLRQKVWLILTIFVLITIPISLASLKYTKVFKSKAAGQFGRIVVYEPGMITESSGVADTNYPNAGGFSRTVNSSLVTLHIYFPNWNEPQQQTFVKNAYAQTNGGCADSNGDRHLSDGSIVKCTNYDGTGNITQKTGESFQYDTRCESERFLNNYYWSSCQSVNTTATEGACADSSGSRHFSDGTVGVCTSYDGTGTITQRDGENFQYDTRCESSRFLDNYYWNSCPKGTSTSYPNNNPNTNNTLKPTLGSRCNVSDITTCGPVSGEGGRQLYCRQFDDDSQGGIWVEKQDTLSRCARGEVRKAVQACNPRVYACQDGKWVVDTFQLVGPGGISTVGACCSTNSDCDSTEVCDFTRPNNASCGYGRGTCQRGSSGGTPPTTGSQPTPTPQIIWRGENETCDDVTYKCREGFECRNVGNEPGRGTRECRPSNNPTPTPEPKFTRYLFIKNENVDFSNPETFVSFTFSESDSNKYINNAFLIPHYALSQTDTEQKTITVRFCPTANVEGSECREQQISIQLKKININPPPPPPTDQVLNRIKDSADKLGIDVTIQTDGSMTMKYRTPEPGQPPESIYKFPRLTEFGDEDLEFLVYVLQTKYRKHPYYELCPIINNARGEDRQRFHDVLTKYGLDAPILPAKWTSAQLQQLNDPLYKDSQGNPLKDGVGPLPLPCNIQSSLVNDIFSYTNHPDLEKRKQLLAGNTGLSIPDTFLSDPKELKLHEDKLSALILLEQATWIAADIQLASKIRWVVTMAEMMPITTPYPALAQVWKYILPGETIEKAIALNDRGAPISFTIANYGQQIIGNFALLVAPVGLTGSLEGQVGGRLATQISRNRYPNIVLVIKDSSTGKILLFDGDGSISENALKELKISERSGNSITEVAEPKKSNFLIEAFGNPIDQFGQEIGSGSHGVSYSDGRIVTKIYFNNAQGNINHIDFYEKWGGAGGEYGLQRYYGKVTVNGVTKGVRLEYIPGLTLAEFGKAIKEGTTRKLTATEVKDAVRTLENIQRTTGQAMVDMAPGNFIVQDLPNGKKVVRPIDYGGQYPETDINFMQWEINRYRDRLTDYCGGCVKN